CVQAALEELRIAPADATAVVQGFGNVGSVTCEELHKIGVKVIAVGDRYGAVRNPKGIDVPALVRYASTDENRRKTVVGIPVAEAMNPDDLLATKCTVLVPAALEREVTGANAGRLNCRVLADGANGPTTPEADAVLADGDIYI